MHMRPTLGVLLLFACVNAWPQTPKDALTGNWIFEMEYRGDRMTATRAQMNVADRKLTDREPATRRSEEQRRAPVSISSGSLATAPSTRVSPASPRMAGSP